MKRKNEASYIIHRVINNIRVHNKSILFKKKNIDISSASNKGFLPVICPEDFKNCFFFHRTFVFFFTNFYKK